MFVDGSRETWINNEGVTVAKLLRMKKRTGRALGSSRLNLEKKFISILTQEDLDKIKDKYSVPPNIKVRLPRPGEKANSFDKDWTYFYV